MMTVRRMRLILIRHGETELNRTGRIQGLYSDLLNKSGRLQARAVAEAIAVDIPFTLYTKPITRAMETAKVVSPHLGIRVTHLNDLPEADAGDLVALTGDEMRQRYPNFMVRWNSGAGIARMPGGKSLDAVRMRAWQAIAGLHADHRDDTVIAITHNQTIRTIIATALDMPLRHFRRLSCTLDSIARLDLSEDEPLLISLNEAWHLTKILSQTHTSNG